MTKLFSNEKLRFFTKVTAAHTFTYFFCGLIFMQLLNYDDVYLELLGFKPMDEISGLAIILGQVVRGILLGIVSTYGPAPGSIEGLIYLAPVDVPINIVSSIFEVLLQPLLFSIIVTFQRKKQ